MPEEAKKKVDFDFDNEHKVMQMFSESAKLYIQLGDREFRASDSADLVGCASKFVR